MPRYNPTDYDPNSRGEFTPPPEGDYNFVVVGATEKTSQAGNEMLNLQLAVDVGRDDDMNVYGNLVFTPNAIWMVHDFCAATGCDFSTGELTPQDVQGRSGVAHFAMGKPNTKGKRYFEPKYFKTRAGFSEQPSAGSMGPNRSRVTAPPMTDDDRAQYGDPDDSVPPPPPNTYSTYEEAQAQGGDKIPF